MKTTLTALHDALEARWKAAGKPPSATEQSLWAMERIIDDLEGQQSLDFVYAEGVDLLEAWIEAGDTAVESELAVLQKVKAELQSLAQA
jgi:hypothetical protein